MTKKENKRNYWLIVIGIVILVIIILLFVFSFGKIDYVNESPLHKRRKWVENRIARLTKQIDKKVSLRETLDKFVSRTYFWVRFTIVFFYILGNILLCWKIKDLGMVLNINQALFILFLAISFVKFDKPSDIFKLLKSLRLKIKRKVYNGYLRHTESIDLQSAERITLLKEKENLDDQINKMDTDTNK